MAKKLDGSELRMNAIFCWKSMSKQTGAYVHLDEEDRDEMTLKVEDVERKKKKRS